MAHAYCGFKVGLLVVVFWLAGCAPMPVSTPASTAPPVASPIPRDRAPAVSAAVSTDRSGVTVHLWRAISAQPLERWDGLETALYTYVLVGDIGARDQDINAATRRAHRALEQLLKEVQAGQGITRGPAEMLAQANQFCIPAVATALNPTARAESARVTPESYDFELSRSYLNLFRFALQSSDPMTRSLSGLGPFLIASRKPLGEIMARSASGALSVDTASPILVIDMTGKHERSMPAYVSAFQQTVRKDVVGRTSPGLLLESVGAALLTLNEALPFVAEAHAGTTRIFLPR